LAATPHNLGLTAMGAHDLNHSTPEGDWSAQPWAHNKAYLVFPIKDEMEESNNNWLPDGALGLKSDRHPAPPGSFSVLVNGVARSVHEFKTKRQQPEKVTK
jgi:hypothetical protein